MLYPKTIIIAVCCAIALVAAIYFGGQYVLEEGRPDNTPTTSADKPITKQPPMAQGHWHGDVWHADDTPKAPQPVTTTQPHLEKEPVLEEVPSRDDDQFFLSAFADDPLSVDLYNFYKEHPHFVYETASPQLQSQWTDIVYQVAIKKRAAAQEKEAGWAQLTAELEQGYRKAEVAIKARREARLKRKGGK